VTSDVLRNVKRCSHRVEEKQRCSLSVHQSVKSSSKTQSPRRHSMRLTSQYHHLTAFIHSYSFIISCQNATKHELGDELTRDCSMTLQYKMI